MADNAAILALPEAQRLEMYGEARNNMYEHFQGTPEEWEQIDERMRGHFGISSDDDAVPPRAPGELEDLDRRLGGLEDPPNSDSRPSDPQRQEPPPTEERPAPESEPPVDEDPELSDKDPEETGKETECDAGCKAGNFGWGLLEGLIPTTWQDAAMMAVMFGIAATGPLGAAAVLGFGIGMLIGGAANLARTWDNGAQSWRGLGQLVGGVLPIILAGVRGTKTKSDGDPPPTRPTDPNAPRPDDGAPPPQEPPRPPAEEAPVGPDAPNDASPSTPDSPPRPRPPHPGKVSLSPEMQNKILYGEPKPSKPKEIRGGHSADIKNNPNYQIEIVRNNPDGTTTVHYRKQLPDGTWSKPKKNNTLAPDNWSNDKILDVTKQVGEAPPVAYNPKNGNTLHRDTIDGVMWEVIRDSNGNVTSSYPTGGTPSNIPDYVDY